MEHFGLTFTRDHVERARANRAEAPLTAAWQQLADPAALTSAPVWQIAAFRWRLSDDHAAGAAALSEVHTVLTASPPDPTHAEGAGRLIALAQAVEMLRDHPAYNPQLTAAVGAQVASMTEAEGSPIADRLWAAAARLAVGIVTEQMPLVESAVEGVRATVDSDVRPQGYITKAVHGEDGSGMRRQVQASAALVLMAEMAAHIGIDVWTYNVRGVSVVTAAMYPIYYFYTTEKWKWDPGLKPEAVQTLFRQYGGYLEILHARFPHKDLRALLEDLRPLVSPEVGGLTTLTHGSPDVKRRGLFGFGKG